MNSSYDLTLEEQKIILTLASMVQPTDEDFKSYKFRISDFMELVGVEDKSKYVEIPKITKELMKKVFEIQEGNKLIQTAWLSGAIYEKGTGYVELTFSQYLKPYMLQLKEKFTQYQLANVLTMKSKYSPRIYEILKCNEFKKQGYIDIDVEELRKLLRADNIYPLYADFKRKIILQTQKELKRLSDISFEFEEIKTGRKVTSIKFYIHSNKKCSSDKAEKEICATLEEDPKEKEFIKIVQNIIDEPITELEAKKLLDTASGDVDTIKEKYEIAKSANNIKNLVGWLTIAIKHKYKFPTEKVVQRKFCNFEQREYDWDELENGLLGKDSIYNKEDQQEDECPINFNQSTNDNIDDKPNINLITEQIKKLGELKELGLLTLEEFENKKAVILNKIY